MPHKDDLPFVDLVPNGWVLLEEGELIPRERMYCNRMSNQFSLCVDPVFPSMLRYDPGCHRVLARRITATEREW